MTRLSEDAAAELGERLQAARDESETCYRPCCAPLDRLPVQRPAAKPYWFVVDGLQWPIHRFVGDGTCTRCRAGEGHDVHAEVAA